MKWIWNKIPASLIKTLEKIVLDLLVFKLCLKNSEKSVVGRHWRRGFLASYEGTQETYDDDQKRKVSQICHDKVPIFLQMIRIPTNTKPVNTHRAQNHGLVMEVWTQRDRETYMCPMNENLSELFAFLLMLLRLRKHVLLLYCLFEIRKLCSTHFTYCRANLNSM